MDKILCSVTDVACLPYAIKFISIIMLIFVGYARDGMPHTVMGYVNGPSAFGLPANGKSRKLIVKNHLSDPAYRWPSSIPLGIETHGGEDVAIYAKGPGSWLFHR